MTLVQFGELFQLIRNGMNIRQSKSAEGIPITRIETISNSSIDPSKVGYAGLTSEAASQWLLRDGDLLFSHINSVDHIGKCAVYRRQPDPLVHGMNLLLLRCKDDRILPDYAAHLIGSRSFRAKLLPYINRAVNQASISIGNLKTIQVSVPCIGEQRHIVEILSCAEELSAKRRRALVLLDELAQTTFLHMFGDPAQNPMDWPLQPLADMARIVTGSTPSRRHAENYGGVIEWIKSDNIDPAKMYVSTASESLSETGARTARIVDPGSILVTCIAGSHSRIGDAAMTDRRVAFNQQINAVCPNGPDGRFLYGLLRASKRLVQDQSTGGMTGIVSKSKFGSIRLIHPPLELQQEFAASVGHIDALKRIHQESLAELDDLFASLQHRAFCGEV